MIRNGIYTDGRILPFGNGTICLKRIRNRDDKHIRIYRKHAEDGSYLLCMVSGIENNESAYRAAVTGWFREYARVHLKEKADFYAKEMQVTFNRIAIKEQKTRWGSCSSKGNINFNWKLVLMPEQIQDYVVVHELAHRIQMNHSEAFWQIVESILPEYRTYIQWMRKHEREIMQY